MKENPLLPFAFTRSESTEIALDTTPRDRKVRDENAESMYHTRNAMTSKSRPALPNNSAPPSLKRKPGESFSERDHIKRRELDDFGSDSTATTDTDVDVGGGHPQDAIFGVNSLVLAHSKFGPPSSPPIQLHTHLASEFDFSTKNFDMPDSPDRMDGTNHDEYDSVDESDGEMNNSAVISTMATSSQLNTSGSIVQALKHLSSDADFGIDRFNRFRAPAFFSTDDDRREKVRENDRKNQLKARDIVLQAFENIQTKINLEGMHLKEVPEEVQDFDDLVVFDMNPSSSSSYVSYQLYLTNNKIRVLPPSLFKFTKLNVLALRLNKLTRIPKLICKLKNLTDLYIGTNRLQWLPCTILELKKLSVLLTGPNPFIPVPSDAVEISHSALDGFRCKKFVTRPTHLRGHLDENSHAPPSLKALCLNSIAKYDVSYQETKDWKKSTPKLHHELIAKTIVSGQYENTCSECDLIVVEPVAESFEWWDILGNKLVPIRREFCSARCMKKWEQSLNEIEERNDT